VRVPFINCVSFPKMVTFLIFRAFCNRYDKRLNDFNFGTMIRLRSAEAFGEHNSFFGVRVQFVAIELARNREGHNEVFRKLQQ